MSAERGVVGRGFAGLENLVSDVKLPDIPAANAPAASAQAGATVRAAAAPAALPPEDVGANAAAAKPRFKIAKIFWIAVAIVVVIWIASQDGNKRTPSTAYNAVPSAPTAAVVQDPSSPPFNEHPPEAGDPERVLNRREIEYCLAESARLTTREQLVNQKSQFEINRFNEAINDYNGRCSSFRYSTADMDVAKAVIAAHQADIDAEARAWVEQLRRDRKKKR